MTALARRRRRSTLVASGLAVAATVLAGGLTVAGALTLYNSTDGGAVRSVVPEMVFPQTPTALLAAVDDEGQLASMTMLVVQPGGSGGSLVPVPVSADASAGEGEERLPIAETAAQDGVEAVVGEAEVALSLSIDTAEVVDAARLTELLGPIGAVEVDLPDDVTDHDGEVVAESGPARREPAELAAVLTARDPDVPAADQYPAAAAVWSAVTAAIGDGLTPPGGGRNVASAAVNDDIAPVLAQVVRGPVRARALHWTDADDSGVDDVVLLDRVELALVFGQIAPGKVSAPNPSLSVRIVVAFTDEQLASRGLTNADVAYEAAATLVFLRANVLSVDTTAGTAPTATVIELADPALTADGADQVLGPVEVRTATTRVAGVDAVITLGTDYLDVVDAARADGGSPGTAPEGGDEDGDVDPVDPVDTSTAPPDDDTTAGTPPAGTTDG